jgi:hypothetical protein
MINALFQNTSSAPLNAAGMNPFPPSSAQSLLLHYFFLHNLKSETFECKEMGSTGKKQLETICAGGRRRRRV